MYSEDLYAAHQADHSVLIIYATVFAIVSIGLMLKLVFKSESTEFVNPVD